MVYRGKMRTGAKEPVAVKKMKSPTLQAQAAAIDEFAAVSPSPPAFVVALPAPLLIRVLFTINSLFLTYSDQVVNTAMVVT